MTTKNFSEAAKQCLARRVAGSKADNLAAEIRPESVEEALALQQEMIKQRPDGVTAWKCLLPISEQQLIVAPIFADSVQSGEQVVMFKDKNKARVEPEIVFILGKDLPAREEDYSEEEINEAIGSCHMALELMQDRYAADCDVTFAERLGDCLFNQGLFIGPEIDKEAAFKAAKISLTIRQIDANGEVSEHSFDGKHPNPCPQDPVYWVINFMSKRGTSFKKGDAFTTGSYAGIVEVDFDKKTEVTYQGLGQYTVEFKEL